jgi:hypothetical protein
MTPEERQLITGLFDRMRGFALTGKDGEAEALIKQQVGGLPDAPYMLVQSVLVQEHALQQADSRIKALEEQVRALQETQHAPAPGGGSFLGGLFGNRAAPEPDRQADRGNSVPAVGARATPSVYGSQPAWAAPQAGTQPPGGQPGAQPGAPTAPPQGGGFLRSAMATAAGVAGGMLAANAIGSLLGGSGNTNTGTSTSTAAEQAQGTGGGTTTGASQASHSGETQGQGHHEAAYEDDDDDDGGWLGGDGGDFEV